MQSNAMQTVEYAAEGDIAGTPDYVSCQVARSAVKMQSISQLRLRCARVCKSLNWRLQQASVSSLNLAAPLPATFDADYIHDTKDLI
jgi:hypothetical protein